MTTDGQRRSDLAPNSSKDGRIPGAVVRQAQHEVAGRG
jgi:hypothetical protein